MNAKSGSYAANATTWITRLREAVAPDQVIEIVNEYLASLPPSVLESIPDHCRPGPVTSADQIAEHAYRLVREQCGGEMASDETDALASIFALASQRIPEIAAESQRSTDREEAYRSSWQK
jgi:hypothetical protein